MSTVDSASAVPIRRGALTFPGEVGALAAIDGATGGVKSTFGSTSSTASMPSLGKPASTKTGSACPMVGRSS